MMPSKIIALLPYSSPFLFVDELIDISENGVTGNYTFKPSEFFYQGHFKNAPVTPGVILTETMAQIGLVCLGIYLLKDSSSKAASPTIALTSTQIEFLQPVFPSEKVTVVSKKIYFRFNKLKCNVEMIDSKNSIVCSGTIAGIIKFTT